MHELESHIRTWRDGLAASDAIDPDTLRELESHLRDAVDGGLADGLEWEDAFARARESIGKPKPLNAEFRKVRGESWSRRVLWIVCGYIIVGFALSVVSFASAQLEQALYALMPDASLSLPWTFEAVASKNNIFTSHLPEGTYLIERIPVAVALSKLAHLFILVLLGIYALRFLRGKTPRLSSWLGARSPLAKLTLLGLMAAALASPYYWLRRIGFVTSDPEYHLANYVLGEYVNLVRIAFFALLIVLAYRALARNRHGSEWCGWLFGGFFVVTGIRTLAVVVAGLLGIGSYLLFPHLQTSMEVASVLPHFLNHNAAASVVVFLAEVTILSTVYILAYAGMFVQTGKRVGRLASRLFRLRWNLLLLFAAGTLGLMVWSSTASLALLSTGSHPIVNAWPFEGLVFGISMLEMGRVNLWFWIPVFALCAVAYLRERKTSRWNSEDALDA